MYGPPYKRWWPGVPTVAQWFTPLNTYQGKPENPLIKNDEECRRFYEATAKLVSEKTQTPAKV